jgi:hypothetical protein
MIITHLEFEILIALPTLHSTTISNEDLKIRNKVDKAMELLNKSAVNKIMGATTINQHHNLPMFDVSLDLQCLWGRNTQEGMKRYDRFLWFDKDCNWSFGVITWVSFLWVRNLI